nr:polymerase [Mediterranean bat virus]
MDLLLEDSDPSLLCEDDFTSDGFDAQDRITFLNSFDYNLNSPLISDDVKYLLLRHQGYPVPLIWRQKNWDAILGLMTHVNLDWKGPDDHHAWFASWIGREVHQVKDALKFLDLVDKDSQETFIVLKTFLKGWIDLDVTAPDRSAMKTNEYILMLTQKFLDLHRIVLMLNCTGKQELTALKDKFHWKSLLTGWTRSFVSLGKVILAQGFVILVDAHLVIDRNFLLMAKDTVIARMQTLLSMIGRLDDKFIGTDIEELIQVYNIGDNILRFSGSSGYDILKMVEPICNLKLTELAREYRPLIPEFPQFKRHVSEAIQNFTRENPKSQDLYDHIMKQDRVELVLTIYGSFRHWGHPYINYVEGLEKLYSQVTMVKQIDKAYAERLASDLTRMVLYKMFQEKKKWFVDGSIVSDRHPFKKHIQNCTWPTGAQILDFGDHWHELPLIQCFEIPDFLDPSVIYADKSHSLDRSQVLKHVALHSNRPIPTEKVMKSVLTRPATNWPAFLREVNDHGLSNEDLVIGLKAKERELKTSGRFFSLMSWRLREYFVVTEYLIKTHFVPLFNGLTMADDLTSVMKKMMDTSSGQGRDDYDKVTIANHIDYEKWNNHQRGDANNPVFRVMGQFLGYPNLIVRTHEFFERSLIYYNQRPDLMRVVDGTLENNTAVRVCWNGQSGGLEGLRQKGWSIVNLLVIARESKIRNTSIKTLAQGDNQVICTHYRLRNYRNERELVLLLEQIKKNNDAIMSAIESGTNKLGLIINKDETIQSADYLNYGKVPIFRGLIRGLECKRWSRVTCVTNDQLPTCANLMSSVSTNALTVAHFDLNPINAMNHFNFFGNFARRLMEIHNPAMRSSLRNTDLQYKAFSFKVAVLYLDPSIGGVCGTALTRFLIRSFPDPVTESLSFWKLIYHTTDNAELKQLACNLGRPKIAMFRADHIDKLLEDPTSLNIAMGMSPTNLIKTKIKDSLVKDRHSIQNEVIRDSIIHLHQDDQELRDFLWSIDPLFPRFLSEFKSGTFMGVAEGVVSLFQNSRTVRSMFKKQMSSELDALIYKSEESSLAHLCGLGKDKNAAIWDCSSDHADLLRRKSWGRPVLGATIPHPIEMHGTGHRSHGSLGLCPTVRFDYISVHCVGGLRDSLEHRGKLAAYIGSKTAESTSILQPWERETKVPIIRRATRLRDAIHWFVSPDSNLAKSIMNNLTALTGEAWDSYIIGFKRTGSALHRFTTTRMSHGGFAAQSPACLTRLLATTDTMRELNERNYDFMYQASLLYSQMSVTSSQSQSCTDSVHHFHIACLKCVREIQEPTLESVKTYAPRDMSGLLRKWKGTDVAWGSPKPTVSPKTHDWSDLTDHEKSYHIGRGIGFLFGELASQGSTHSDDSSIFPLSIQYKVRGPAFLNGMLDGLLRAGACQVIHRRNVQSLHKPANALYGGLIHLIDKLSSSPQFENLCRVGPIRQELDKTPHKIPPSYPTSNSDMGSLIRTYFNHLCKAIERGKYKCHYPAIWIFSDTASLDYIGPFVLSTQVVNILYQPSLNKQSMSVLRGLSLLSSSLRSGDVSGEWCKEITTGPVYLCTEEIRHAAKGIPERPLDPISIQDEWGSECFGSISYTTAHFAPHKSQANLPCPPRVQDPLISGLRLGQLPTGAHYKLRSIIKGVPIKYADFICGGDGSGGMTAALLRLNKHSRGIFNSLMLLDDVSMRGSSPDPPNALNTLGSDSARCVNGNQCWEDSSDLTVSDTWKCFLDYKQKKFLHLDLMVFDMEATDFEIPNKIALLLRKHLHALLEMHGTVVFKTYGTILCTTDTNPLTILGPLFEDVLLCQTEFSSSHTSEIYLVCRRVKKHPIPLYPIWRDLNDWWMSMAAFRGNTEEFSRAYDVIQKDTTAGIPPIFIPDHWLVLKTLLQIANVPGGVSFTIVDLLEQQKVSGPTLSVILGGVVSYYTIDHIRLHPLDPGPPSDGAVSNLVSALIGIGFAHSIIMKELDVYNSTLTVNNNAFPVRVSCQFIDSKYRLRWSTSGQCAYYKDNRPSNKQANIGQWIRSIAYLHRGKRTSAISVPLVNSILRVCNKKLTYSSIKRRTGVIQFLSGKADNVDWSVPSASVGTNTLNDQTWRGDL